MDKQIYPGLNEEGQEHSMREKSCWKEGKQILLDTKSGIGQVWKTRQKEVDEAEHEDLRRSMQQTLKEKGFFK